MFGRNDIGLPVVIPDQEVLDDSTHRYMKSGDYVLTKVWEFLAALM